MDGPEPSPGVALVERERQTAELEASLARTRAGRGEVVLLAGEAGVGKTTLARQVLAASGLPVLTGFGAAGGVPAFGPIVEVLRSYLRTDGPARLDDGPLAGRLAQLLPELGPPGQDGDLPTLLEALRQALASIAAAGPVAVFLDDLHWADDATVELIPALARWVAEVPMLVLVAYRSDELPRGHAVRRMRVELRRAGLLRQIGLEPLSPEGTAVLLERTVGAVTPALRRAVFARTDGLPFYVAELGAALVDSGSLLPGPAGQELPATAEVPMPDGVRDAVMLRAAGLSPQARDALTVAAVAGTTFDPDLVTAVASLPEWPDQPFRLGLVEETTSGQLPGQLSFRHALVREAFYAEISWTRRRKLHEAVAGQLELRSAAPAVVADHWIRAGRPDRARPALLVSARQSRSVHAYRDAARATRRAIAMSADDDPDRPALLEQLAGDTELAGDLGAAISTWLEVVERRREQAGLPLATAYRRLAAALELQGRWQEALAAREQAAEVFTAAGLPVEAAADRLASAAHLRAAGSFRAAVALLETAGRQARTAGAIELAARIRGHEGNARARMGEPGAVEMVRAALAVALEHGFTITAADIYQRLADALEHAGDYPAASETYEAAAGFCAANELEPTAQLCNACLTAILRQNGDWDRTVSLCRQVLASAGSTVHSRVVATGMLGSVLGLRGQARAARPLLLESLSSARRIELTPMEMLASWGLAVLDQTEGATDSAAANCHAIVECWRRTEDRHYAVPPLRWATTFLAESGDHVGARTCAAALATVAADTDQDEIRSALTHALAETALLDGEPELAATRFTRSLGLLAGVEAPFDRAESHRRLAGALVLTGRRDDAVGHLEEAYRTARRLKARPLADRVAADLARLGEQADRRGPSAAGLAGPAQLTRRELQVVRLVAAGRTNKEIAAELFLSPRTVETHVGNAVAKLDCRSRADAARRASELGLLAG